MILLLDNFDSFTYNLVDYFQQVGVRCHVIRNDASLAEIQQLEFLAICLSPGPETPTKAGIMPEVIAKYHTQLPILGICLGHQAIGMHFGATLKKAKRPMHGKISSIRTNPEDILFKGLPNTLEVVRYHSLVIQNLPDDLKISASSSEGEIMGISHRTLPLHGVQFHPEAWLTQHGITLLQNWSEEYGLV